MFNETFEKKNISPIKPREDDTEKKIKSRQTPEKLQKGAEKAIKLFCRSFKVEGEDNIRQALAAKEKGEKFVISSSHISNLDGAAAIKALGNNFDIQIVVDSRHFDWPGQRIMYNYAGRENFSGVEYKEYKKHGQPVFNPENFDELEMKMADGKTPWVASHSYSDNEKMLPPRIGAIYLAQKTGAKIIPTALELSNSGSISYNGPIEFGKGLLKRADATYHIGQPIQLKPVSNLEIIEKVLMKRKNKEKVVKEEMTEFHQVHNELEQQAKEVADIISSMLPEKFREEERAPGKQEL